MKVRVCPNCKVEIISVAKLALMLRSKCTNCKSKIGVHWVFSSIYYCFSAVVLGFLGIYLSVNFSILSSLVLLLGAFTIMSILVGLFAPLEAKQKWWEP